jgi:glutamine cyclotransferase
MIKKLHLVLLVSIAITCCRCNNTKTEDGGDTPPAPQGNGIKAPEPITFTIEAVYPHDPTAFTQGLEFHNGKLYEGTGLEEKSTLRIVDIKTGVPEKKYLIPDPKIFGEGITIFNNKIYQLTWQNHTIFVYNLNDITKPIATLKWKLEGWGLTNDGKSLIVSDGSDHLFYVWPQEATKDIRVMKILSVADNNGKVDSLNELEYIDGYIYANRWTHDDIYKIDTTNGHVVGKLNLAGLLHQYAPNEPFREGSVLNGIAYDSTTKKVYITGKDWPKLFEMKFN